MCEKNCLNIILFVLSQEFHRELLGKEGLVEDIRKKAQDLLKSKAGVPGLDSLQVQLSDLGRVVIVFLIIITIAIVIVVG